MFRSRSSSGEAIVPAAGPREGEDKVSGGAMAVGSEGEHGVVSGEGKNVEV